MDYNEVGNLLAQVSSACTHFAMVTERGGLLSFYLVPRWEKKEGYYYKTDFQMWEIEGKILALEYLRDFVNKKVSGDEMERCLLTVFSVKK